VFFYKVALKLKSVDDIAKWAFKMGLGKKTGVGLAREIPGLIPTEEWKQKRYNQQWNAGETVSVAIGQSFVLSTVLQMANLYAAVGNGGTLYRPYLVKKIESYEGQVLKEFSPDVISHFSLHPKTLELVKQGIWGAINIPHGTAFASKLPGMDFAGKTGSAQVVRQAADKRTKCENAPFHERDNAVFVGIAPLNDPAIAVAVVAEHACHGASGAAPIAKEVVKAYLQKLNPALYSDKAIAERLKSEGETTKFSAKMSARTVEDEEDEVETNNENLPATAPPAPPLPPLPDTPNDSRVEVPGVLNGNPDE
jgi:penicillin-binding protein 2